MKDLRATRARILWEIRCFFHNRGFIETDTPSLVESPGMEPHIRPIKIEGKKSYLPTSPEFAMKRLLAEGYDKIFQLSKAYRDEPLSSTHNPEFCMLEWYRANSDYEAIMDDVEELFVHIAKAVGAPEDVSRPWPRLTIEECFRRFAGRELTKMLPAHDAKPKEKEKFNDDFFRIFLNEVEPELAKLGRPVILYAYPESQAALSNIMTDERGYRWAKRFEVYAGGFELGNAFDELIDVEEQRRRFEADMTLREELYGLEFPRNPIDEKFMEALKKMPPSGGIAMGVDRIVMYFTGATNIHDVLWLESFWPAKSQTE